MNDFGVNPLGLIRNSSAKTIFIYSNVDYIGTLHSQNTLEENHQIWLDDYNELFKNKPELEEVLQKFKHKKGLFFILDLLH